jgi:radical SAM protein (TIGR01212 family)
MTNRTIKKSQRPFLYRSLASYLREIFGRALKKVSIDPGFGCPNRDGTIGTEGCSFCNMESFVPAHALNHGDPAARIASARKGRESEPFIAYLQAGTGTYTTGENLRELVNGICETEGVAGLFIGTRPDCVDEAKLDILVPWSLRKLVWLELGLQSAANSTLERIGRGHDVKCFTEARELARSKGIQVLAHIILGLPGEGPEEMMETARYLAGLEVEGVKIHHLQVIKNTPMEKMLHSGKVKPLDVEYYPSLVADFLERLPPWTVVHRLAADAPGDLLIAPRWPDRQKVIEAIRRHMLEKGKWQGRLYLQERREEGEGGMGEKGKNL